MAIFGRRRRERGTPPQGASSFHLWWEIVGAPFRTVAVTLQVDVPPQVEDLYFWALQVGFAGAAGRTGGAHLGLQWNRGHPGMTAVNWGGYRMDGSVLDGSASDLPSAPDDPNTRDLAWRVGVPYRLSVSPTPGLPGWWRGEITDATTGRRSTVRDLHGGGDGLVEPVVWSEVFAPCEAPGVTVSWSDPVASTSGGELVVPGALRVTYQPFERGGCTNTTVSVEAGVASQTTSTPRLTREGTRLALR